LVRTRAGLVLDPYFSAAKIAWLLDAEPGRRAAAEAGKLLAGTIDCWLAWKLSGGSVHVTDATNASRTSLMDLAKLDWDPMLLALFDVPRACLPRIVPSAGPIADLKEGPLRGVPLTGIAGDQQASLFGHRCCTVGECKNTYGTGCFLLRHTGPVLQPRRDAILTTVACGPAGQPEYAWEGSVFMAGAVVQWLRDELGVLPTAAASEDLARQVPDTGGVTLVPAFTGLGAPYWDSEARGAILGLTRGSGQAHLARAALEAIAFQSVELDHAMMADSSGGASSTAFLNTASTHIAPGAAGAPLNVDGGATANSLLMQTQADLLGRTVLRARQAETTALGAAYLAGIGAGVWADIHDVPPGVPPDPFQPTISGIERSLRLDRWRRAVAATRQFGS
ncbi:MAG: glycerol kinase, partial [Chloroflexi bacterium]|nr:glycerol kinase [Chloroflexota bacterium]